MKYGNVISELRKKKGITQKDMSNDLHISGSYLSLIEKDKKMPTNELLQKISDYLEIPLFYFHFKGLEVDKEIKANKRATYKQVGHILSNMIESIFIEGNEIN